MEYTVENVLAQYPELAPLGKKHIQFCIDEAKRLNLHPLAGLNIDPEIELIERKNIALKQMGQTKRDAKKGIENFVEAVVELKKYREEPLHKITVAQLVEVIPRVLQNASSYPYKAFKAFEDNCGDVEEGWARAVLAKRIRDVDYHTQILQLALEELLTTDNVIAKMAGDRALHINNIVEKKTLSAVMTELTHQQKMYKRINASEAEVITLRAKLIHKMRTENLPWQMIAVELKRQGKTGVAIAPIVGKTPRTISRYFISSEGKEALGK